MTETPTPEPEVDLQAQLDAALADVDKWKALSRKNEDTAKSNLEKARKFDELEESNKSELQKLQEQLNTVSSEKDALSARQLRYDIAAKHGLHGSEVKLLNGSTEEELDAAAQLILELRGSAPKAPSAEGQGKVGDPIGGKSDQLSREQLNTLKPGEIAEALKAGRLDDLLGRSKKGAN